ncbi:MAG: hypothetical protein ACOC8E_00690 [Planctomycetota bacterium]
MRTAAVVICMALGSLAGCRATPSQGGGLAGVAVHKVAPDLDRTLTRSLPKVGVWHQRHPAVAYGDGQYLLVWQNGYNGLGGDSDILGLRIGPTGAPLDPAPITICAAKGTQESPAVAFCRGRFLVAWSDLRNGTDHDVYAALVDREGNAGTPFRLAGGTGGQAHPAVASDGKDTFLAVWQDYRSGKYFEVYGARVSARSADVLEKGGFRVMPRGARPAVAWTGKCFVVAQRWYAATVRGDTAEMAADGKRLWNGKTVFLPDITAAWGKGFVFFNVCPRHDPWGWGGNGAIIGCTVLPDGTSPEWDSAPARRKLSAFKADGKIANCLDAARWKGHPGWPMGRPGGFKTTEEGTWPSGHVAAAFNGRSLVVVWPRTHIVDKQRVRNRDLYVRRVLDDWAYRDKAKIELVAGPTEEAFPVLAAGKKGHTLLAYEKVRPDGGVAVEYCVLFDGVGIGPP